MELIPILKVDVTGCRVGNAYPTLNSEFISVT